MNFKTLVPTIGLSALTLAGCGKAAKSAAPKIAQHSTEFVQKADTFVNTKATQDILSKMKQNISTENVVAAVKKAIQGKKADTSVNTKATQDILSKMKQNISTENIAETVKKAIQDKNSAAMDEVISHLSNPDKRVIELMENIAELAQTISKK